MEEIGEKEETIDVQDLRWFKNTLEKIESISNNHFISDEILGRKFNIFQLIRSGHEEVAVHSRFLGALLDPQGRHGMGSAFLKLFLKDVVNRAPGKCIDFKSSFQVYLEKSHVDGRLDICIESKANKACVVIENKIYAKDQYAQIERYANYTKLIAPESNKRIVLYLTLHGREPDSTSYGNISKGEYSCISYKVEILEWLMHCLCIAMDKPFVRENISQYIDLIKQFTGVSGVNMNNDLKAYLIEKINAKALKKMYFLQKAVDEIQDERVQQFHDDVCEKIEQLTGRKLQKKESKPFTCSNVRAVGSHSGSQIFILHSMNSDFRIEAGFWLEKAEWAYKYEIENGIGNGFFCCIYIEEKVTETLKITLKDILENSENSEIKKDDKVPLKYNMLFPNVKIDLLREFDWFELGILKEMVDEVSELIYKYWRKLLRATECGTHC